MPPAQVKGITDPFVLLYAIPVTRGKFLEDFPTSKICKKEERKEAYKIKIKEDLPEALGEDRKRFEQMKYMNRKLPTTAQKLTLSFQKNQIQVGGKDFHPPISPPSTKDLMNLTREEIEDVSVMDLLVGEET